MRPPLPRTPSASTRLLVPIVALLALSGIISVPTARAQLDVRLSLSKESYILHETIPATVSITNLAARDIVLNGPGGRSWLTFEVTGGGGGGDLTPTSPGQIGMKPVILRAGQKIERTVELNHGYSLTNRGNFSVEANVWFPPLRRYVSSRLARFNIHEGRLVWQRSVGIPPEMGGGYRRFAVLTYAQERRTTLYIRMIDEATGLVLTTFPLGRVITHRHPQITVDRDNQLHVLYMGAPQIYSHTVVGPDGRIVSRENYRDTGGNSPRLMQASDQTVGIRGGIVYDPVQGELPVARSKIHQLSERPPGWDSPAEPGF